MWLLCLLSFLLLQQGDSQNNHPTKLASLDKLIDQITKNINSKGKDLGFDSLSLPDIYREIKKGDAEQVFNFTKGMLYNLTSIERHGNAVISYKDNVLKVNIGFHFTELQVNYDFNLHMWKLNPTGNLKGGLSDFRIDVEGNFDLNSFKANMSKLEIPTTGKIDFSANTTVPIYGYIVEDLLFAMSPFQDIIIYEIGKELTKRINEILKSINIATLIDVYQ